MATKILREEQRCRSLNVYLLLFLFIGLTVYALVRHFIHSSGDRMVFVELGSLLALLLFITWYVYFQMKMIVKVSEKGIRIRHFPMHPEKIRINWEEVEDYEFVRSSPAAQWSGWGIHFSSFGERYYSLCGRTGLRLYTKTGDQIFIGSRKLLNIKEKIDKMLSRTYR